MKKISLLLLLIISMIMPICVNAQRIAVGDPQEEWWYSNQGTIENAEFVLKPQGLYMGVDMYLTFSGKDMMYSKEDTIELECTFNLPQGSIINDSWLWLNQDTLIADLMDRWTASTIYNEIVGRRQDPSILFKNWNNEYELRIYPMQGDSSRRVKISYLTPFKYSRNGVSAHLPISLLQASYHSVENVKVYLLADTTWTNPIIPQYSNMYFDDQINDTFGTNKTLSFSTSNVGNILSVQFENPMTDGVFFNYIDGDEQDYYQLAVLPSVFIENIEPKKILVGVEFVGNNYFDKDEVYNCVKQAIAHGLNSNDYVNIMFTSTDIKPLFSNWVKVENIEDSILSLEERDLLGESSIRAYSNLPTLLKEGFTYLVDNLGDDFYLIANSYDDGDPEEANALIKDLIKIIEKYPISVHVANYSTDFSEYHWVGNNYYYGNSYLYLNLCKQTGGNTKNINTWLDELDSFILDFTMTIDGSIEAFDLYTSANNGFTYGRLSLNDNKSLVYFNEPVLQVGKFIGAFPFYIEFNGIYNDVPFSKRIEITENMVYENDPLLEEIWAGNFIEDLERNIDQYTNEAIMEIVEYSIQERVLSKYTAFLAIEPSAIDSVQAPVIEGEGLIDDGGWDGEWAVSNEENKAIKSDEIEVFAFPNPFVDYVVFNLSNIQLNAQAPIEIKIYDVTGKLIFNDKVHGTNDSNIEYKWNGNNNEGGKVDKGAYIVVFETENHRKIIKVIK